MMKYWEEGDTGMAILTVKTSKGPYSFRLFYCNKCGEVMKPRADFDDKKNKFYYVVCCEQCKEGFTVGWSNNNAYGDSWRQYSEVLSMFLVSLLKTEELV